MGRALFRVFLLLTVVLHLIQWRLHKDVADGACYRLPPKYSPFSLPESPLPLCRFPPRNPGGVADGRLPFRPIAVPRASELPRGAWREGARQEIGRLLQPWPSLRALSLAVWLGDTSELPLGLAKLYREGGLLHLLALSGQHVASLWLIFALALGALAPLANRWDLLRRVYPWAHVLLPLGGALLLVILNPGNEPMARAAAMLFAWRILRERCLKTTAVQIALSSVALLLLLSPERVASDSFCLSAIATFFLCAWVAVGPAGGVLSQYLALSFALPLLLLPVSAYFFARVSWMAGVNAVLVGWAWTLLWVPAGFAAVGVAAILPVGLAWWILQPVEWGWVFFHQFQTALAPWMGWGYWVVWRPTWWETGVLEGLIGALLWGVLGATRRAGPGRS